MRSSRVIVLGWFVMAAPLSSVGWGSVYDFSSGAGTQHFGYGISVSLPLPPATNAVPTSPFFGSNYTALAASDDLRLATNLVDEPNNLVPAMRFVFTISEARASITRLDIRWEGGANEDGLQEIWLWNAASGSYVLIGSQEDFVIPNEGTVLAAITSQPADYVDANNRVTILVDYFENSASLSTDYVSLTVTGASCNTNAECDDGSYCTGAESCVAGGCQAGTPVNCNDSNACTTDACNEVSQACDHITIDCDDGQFCNGAETCHVTLGCRPGPAVNCNDSNACTIDACNESTDVCDHTAVHCDNGLYCDGVEACDTTLGCRPGTPVNCDDADGCTIDSCAEATDTCNHAPRTSAVPTTPGPADGSIEVAVSATLTWNGGAAEPNCPRVFDVYLDTVSPPVQLVANGIPNTAFTPSTLMPATTYYWQAVNRDCCTSTPGAVWAFTTVGRPLLSANPPTADFAVPTGSTQTIQVTVTNNGNAPTTWTAAELSTAGGGASAPPPHPPHGDPDGRAQRPIADWSLPHDPSTLLVRFKPDAISRRVAPPQQRDAIHAVCGTTKIRSFRITPTDVVRIAPGDDVRTVARRYEAMQDVDFVEPNFQYQVSAIPNDPSFSLLWGMNNTGQTGGVADADIDAPEAWDIATGNQTIIVGVIDTGVDYNHPDLAGNMWTNSAEQNGTAGVDDDGNGIVDDIYGANWTSGTGLPTNGNPFDDHYHGTHCAGTIGGIGNNGVGVTGANWNVRIMALKFLNAGGSGWLSDAIPAIEYAVSKGAHLTSNSWGGGGYSQNLKDAIDAAGAAGQLFVAAAGNSGVNADLYPMYPAAYASPTIISVAATDHSDLRAWFTNYGLTSVDLAAPGVNIYSCRPNGTYQYLSGTSMATPHVSGVAALVLSSRPTTPPLELKQLLMDSVDPIPAMSGLCVTGGRLNAHNAVLLADPAPWLDFTPNTGVLWPGQSVVIEATANAAGLPAGSYFEALVRVTSGDPSGPLDILATLVVSPCTDDAQCDDGAVCNGYETCGPNGLCLPGTPVNCDDGVGCTNDVCVEPTGACTHAADDTRCDNGLMCDGTESCDPTLGCRAGTPVTCPDDGVACTNDVCSEALGGCDHVPDDLLCDNGVFCDGWEYCDWLAGCQPGFDPCWPQQCDESTDTCLSCAADTDCDDGVPCTVDTCDLASGFCYIMGDDTLCDDGLFCNGFEYCDYILGCQPDYCESPCFGQPCDEANDTCGYCVVDADCDDGVVCTVDTCDVATGFCNIVGDDASCDDGLFCNGIEYCDYCLGCQVWYDPCAGSPCDEENDTCWSCLTDADCDDLVACTIDRCNVATGFCSNTADDTLCDNGLYCDGAESCDASLDCRAGTPVDCGDGVECTLDACDEAIDACGHTPSHAVCDNGLYCDGQETCDALLDCQAGTAVDCSDGVGCTGDVCNELTNGCDHVPSDALCSDGVYCNGAEVCDSLLGCQTGTPVDCNDSIVCTVDSCNEALGACEHLANNLQCDDGLYCNGVESCDPTAGCRIGMPVNCNDGIACTSDSCDEATHACGHTPADNLCDDGVFCNGAETCDAAGGCQPGADPCPGQSCDEVNQTCGAGRQFWMVFSGTTVVPGLGAVEDEDVVAYDSSTGQWSLVLDGSDVGLASFAIDGLARRADGAILLSFAAPGNITGLTGGPSGQAADDSDVVLFSPTSLGSNTSGSFTFYFDGSDVALTSNNEDVDAIALDANGNLVLSTLAAFSAAGASGQDEDLIVFAATSLGSVTAGTFTMLFDGSDVALTTNNEDVDAAAVTAAGSILLSTLGQYTVTGATGADEDALEFVPTSLGATTAGSYSTLLDLSTLGIAPAANLTAVEVVE